MEEEFSWSGEDVVVRRVDPVAVYLNVEGDVVMRQQRAGLDEPDSYVLFPAEQAKAIIAAIKKAANIK